jgi:WD40 repeat protein
VVLSTDGALVGVAFNDNESEIWERATGRRRAGFVQHKMGYEIAFRRRSPHLITGSWDGTIKAWELGTLRCEGVFRGSLRGVNSLAVSPDDRTLAAGTGEGVIRLWDLNLGQEVAALKGHRESVGQLAFSQDGRLLLSVGEEAVRTVRRWEAPLLTEIEAAERARARTASP